jgi:multidrug efflux pump subunit AcrA (membrane-fusion protein)
MAFSEDEIQLLINKVDKEQAKARRRTIIAIIIPTLAAILYLGFTVWLISVEQEKLKKIEADLKNRKQELTQVEHKLSLREEQLKKTEETLDRQNDQIQKAQQQIAQGNIVAAQEEIANISTGFRENEINGFRAILEGDLENARRLFGVAYKAYPTYHNVDEIYRRVLTLDRVKAYNSASSSEQQSIQRKIMQEIITNYSWGMSGDLLNEMKSRLAINQHWLPNITQPKDN